MRWLDGINNAMDMNLGKFGEMMRDWAQTSSGTSGGLCDLSSRQGQGGCRPLVMGMDFLQNLATDTELGHIRAQLQASPWKKRTRADLGKTT